MLCNLFNEIVRNPYFLIRSISWDSCFFFSSVAQLNSVSKNVTWLQCSSIIFESLSTSVLQSTRATTYQQSFTICWFLYIHNHSKIVNFLRKQAWTKSLFACKLVIHYKHILKPNILSKHWYSWKRHMAGKNVIYVIFSDVRRLGLNWSLEGAFINHNFFQSSSAFYKSRSWVGFEKKTQHMWMWHFHRHYVCITTLIPQLHNQYKITYKRRSCTKCSSICALTLFL